MNLKRTLIPLALAAVGLALVLAPAGAAPAPKTVKVDDNFFAPDSLAVRKGTLVRFKWVGVKQHNVVKAKGPGPFFQSNPESGEGVHFKHRFKKPGRYRLACTLHENMDMRLRVKGRR